AISFCDIICALIHNIVKALYVFFNRIRSKYAMQAISGARGKKHAGVILDISLKYRCLFITPLINQDRKKGQGVFFNRRNIYHIVMCLKWNIEFVFIAIIIYKRQK